MPARRRNFGTRAVQRLLVIFLFVSGCSDIGWPPPPEAPPSPASLRIAQAWEGSENQHFTPALREALTQTFPGIRVEALNSSAGISNLLMLQRHEVDAAATYADVAYMASIGRLPQIAERFSELRAIATLPTRELQLVVGPGLPIRSIGDLRGRRVSLGPSGTAVSVTARLLLNAYGLRPQDIQVQNLGFDALLPLLNRDVDAMFFGGRGTPNPVIKNAIGRGARLLQIMGPEIDRFRTEYPFLRAVIIPSGTYPGIDEPVHTVGVDRLFVCRADLDERLAYELTKALHQAITTANHGMPMLHSFNLARASATVVPLHPGAARYYREVEMRR